ncbi:MAG: murein transglycosylase A [Alphaproteobacteria bacterium]|jgi:membrane-bound lytic murein transglycosylase A
MVRATLAGGVLLALMACGPKVDAPAAIGLTPTSYDALAGWRDDRHAEALVAFARSCERLIRLADDRTLGADGIAGTVAEWRPPCDAIGTVPAGDDSAARGYFEFWFAPFEISDRGRTNGLFTGYYEASLDGARAPSARFSTPLHARPANLVTVDLGVFRDEFKGERIAGRVIDGRLMPFHDRATIDAGALDGDDLEVVWVDDPVDAFFLHIQGSGRIALADGSELRVGYAAQNGHAYTAVGRILIADGEVTREAMSMQAIRSWLAANPDRARDLMNRNRSYVFFTVLDGDGPLGSEGVALTPGRSLAVDRRFLPMSVPLWLDSTMPGEQPLRRLMIAQDTGGAIKGAVRGDVFWGHGEDAADIAGRMKARGRYYLLLPRTVPAF